MYHRERILETLILCVKNNALLEQRRAIKIKNLKKSELISRVKSLKKVNNEDRDNNAIFRAELALSNFVEKELKFELENYKKFELLNAERITPHFMSLVKNSNKNDCPTVRSLSVSFFIEKELCKQLRM